MFFILPFMIFSPTITWNFPLSGEVNQEINDDCDANS